MKYSILCTEYEYCTGKSSSFDLAKGATVTTEREAWQLLASYVTGLVIQGGTMTFSKIYDEYKVVMPNGDTEYAKLPVIV